MAAAAAVVNQVNAREAAERAARHHRAEVEAEHLSHELAADIAAARPRSAAWRGEGQPCAPSLSMKMTSYICSPAGRDMLHRATQLQPISKLIPQTLQEELMISSAGDAKELRRSARDLRSLLSPSSQVLSVISPLRGKTTLAECRQELNDIYELVMSTCKDELRAIDLGFANNLIFDSDAFEAFESFINQYQLILREFLHRLLNSLENITALKVESFAAVVTHETLQILAARHKNLKYFQLKLTGDPPFTSTQLRTLTSGCHKLEVLDLDFWHFLPSPEDVVSYLQDLPDLKTLWVHNVQKGMFRYAMDHSNTPRLTECLFILELEQEDVWGGEKFDHLLATFPKHESMYIDITDTYSDTIVSRVDSLDEVRFTVVERCKWSLASQARFYSKFSTLTSIRLFSQNSLKWDFDLGVVGRNCLAVESLHFSDANVTFKEVDTHCFKKLKQLTLAAHPTCQARPPDSFLKILLSGPELSTVQFTNVDVSDQALLDLSQQAKKRRGEVFSSLSVLCLHGGLSWPGLRAATVISVACQAPELRELEFSVRNVNGTQGPMPDDLVLSKFFSSFMPFVPYSEWPEP